MITNKTSFAKEWPEMYNEKSRVQKARRVIKILENYHGKLNRLNLLDIGSSTGIMDNFFASKFKSVTGIDSDKKAVEYAKKNFKKKNLKFIVNSGLNLKFNDNSFDVITCSHVYEHVDNSETLFKEIYRVLKPGGVCHFAAINRLWIIEPHYKLPFLSFLPKKSANFYVSIFGKAEKYFENPKSYWGLIKLTKKFKRIEYTDKILRHPQLFAYDDLIKPKSYISYIAWAMSPISRYFAPTFVWLLIKK